MFKFKFFPNHSYNSNCSVRNGKISTQSCSWHGNITHYFDKFSFELDDIYLFWHIFRWNMILSSYWLSFCFCFRFPEPTNSILNLLGSSLKLFQNCFKFQAISYLFEYSLTSFPSIWEIFGAKKHFKHNTKLYFQNKGICKYLNSIFFKISTNKEFY